MITMFQLLRPQNLRPFRPLSLRPLSSLVRSDSLPPNLVLASLDIFEEEKVPKIPAKDYYFPPLASEIPNSIAVRKFIDIAEEVAEQSQNVTVKLDKVIFEVAIRKDIVHDVVRYHRHQLRQPKKTKRVYEISGSKKKPRPQKGTGASQVGNKRNSSWRGGFKAHGPVLRDYSIELNRKVRALGMMMTLAAKFREGNLIVFDYLRCPVSLYQQNYTLRV